MACIFHDKACVFCTQGDVPENIPKNAPQNTVSRSKRHNKIITYSHRNRKKANFVFSSTLGQNHVRVSERTTKHGAVHTRRRRKSK